MSTRMHIAINGKLRILVQQRRKRTARYRFLRGTASALMFATLAGCSMQAKVIKSGGATKPKKFDADITVHQIVTDLSELKIWLKIPQKTDWREIDLKELFTG